MADRKPGRGLFYTRDSGGKHEMTPGEYIDWARKTAADLKVRLQVTAADIKQMMQQGRSASGDLFLDYGVQGNKLSRPGLDAMLREAERDKKVSHIFIPKRDRLARPDDPTDALRIENDLRRQGISLVFMARVLDPIRKGRRIDLSEYIMGVIDYDHARATRLDLAQKILYAQLALAKKGFSTGGRPPFGFRRWLTHEDGRLVRQLLEGEKVRMAQHHVVWMPGPDSELSLIRRILDLLRTMPASRLAALLTSEGVPSPDAGRLRTDNGIRHAVSGVWHQTTISNIARNPLLIAVTRYGVRSMGDQLRFSPEGPRPLEDADYLENEDPKVIRNPEDARITTPARFEPLVNPQEHSDLQSILDQRAGTQRGKPRARHLASNPLGGRVYDLNCTWPMYREPYNGSFRYKCGLYQQSSGAKCTHNHVSGPLAAEFALSCIRQNLVSLDVFPKLRRRLQELAEKERGTHKPQQNLLEAVAALAKIENDLKKISRNMALADSPDQRSAMGEVFDELQRQRSELLERIEKIRGELPTSTTTVEDEVEAALKIAEQLTALATANPSGDAASKLIQLANLKLYFRFASASWGKRTVHRIAGGVVTVGTTPAPTGLYQGPTNREGAKQVSLGLPEESKADSSKETSNPRRPSDGEGT